MFLAARHRIAALCTVLLATLTGFALHSGRADAAPGTFDGATYSNGVICPATSTADAVPLVAWTLPDSDTPAYALGQVTDSHRPATNGTASSISPIDLPATQAATLAWLITHPGDSNTAATTAETAALIAATTSPSPAITDCLSAGVGHTSSHATAALWNKATRRAGPYTITVTPGSPTLTLGTATTVTATVTSATGDPVPGMTVTFTAENATFDTDTATTDGSGTAHTVLTVPDDSTATSIQVTATLTASVSLTQRTQRGHVTLVHAAAARTFTGLASVPVQTETHPELTATTSATTVLPGTVVHGTVHISGMTGHAATGTIALVGPLPFPTDGQGCTTIADGTWTTALNTDNTHALTVTEQPIAVHGDGTYGQLNAAPTKPGCYSITGTITTTNAIPNTDGTLGFGQPAQTITVLPVKVHAAADHSGVAVAGTQSATVSVTSTDPAVTATVRDVTGTLYGVRPSRDGGCPQGGWNNTPTIGDTTIATDADGSAHLSTSDITELGCYAYRLSATIDAGANGHVSYTLTPGQGGSTILVLQPIVQIVNSGDDNPTGHGIPVGGSATATVQVYGTLTQPATITLKLATPTDPSLGCWGAKYPNLAADTSSNPKGLRSGPATTTHGDGTYKVTSPKMPADGCYSLVPVLTLDKNPTVTVTGTPGDNASIAYAASSHLLHPLSSARHAHSDRNRIWATAAIAAALLLLVVAAVVRIAWASRRRDDEPGQMTW